MEMTEKWYKDITVGTIIAGLISNFIYGKLVLIAFDKTWNEFYQYLHIHPLYSIVFFVIPVFISLTVFIVFRYMNKAIDSATDIVSNEVKFNSKLPMDKGLLSKIQAQSGLTLNLGQQLRSKFQMSRISNSEGQIRNNKEINQLSTDIKGCGTFFQTHLIMKNTIQKDFFNIVDLFIRKSVSNDFVDNTEYDKMYKAIIEQLQVMIN